MASYKDILDIANKRIDSGDIPDERVIFDIDSLGALPFDTYRVEELRVAANERLPTTWRLIRS